jgi:hypothetical protein
MTGKEKTRLVPRASPSQGKSITRQTDTRKDRHKKRQDKTTQGKYKYKYKDKDKNGDKDGQRQRPRQDWKRKDNTRIRQND